MPNCVYDQLIKNGLYCCMSGFKRWHWEWLQNVDLNETLTVPVSIWKKAQNCFFICIYLAVQTIFYS